MSTAALDIARERQLDWLLGEVLGEPPRTAARRRHATAGTWLAAAVAVLATGVALAIAALREPEQPAPVQDPQPAIEWHECHGIDALPSVPDGVVNLRCFDFNDAALQQLTRFSKLQRLDLSGMDANERGTSVAISITDAGVQQLAALDSLRWLSLSGAFQVTGSTLDALRVIPLLEHLDVSSTSITSDSIAKLNVLPSLRSLSLSHCLEFHGRSLADVARIPGLVRLELAGCATITAADAVKLAQLKALRHLDLSGCSGIYFGQTAVMLDDVTNGEAPPPPPKHDGIGMTDAVVAALRDLPIETLRLGGCRKLTNGTGRFLREYRRLRHLDIGDLQGTTTELLSHLPNGLLSLSLDGNQHYERAGLRELERFPHLRELGLNGLQHLDDALLASVLANKQLTTLRVGGTPNVRDAMGTRSAHLPKLTPAAATTIAKQTTLRTLELPFCNWLNADAFTAFGGMPALQTLICRSSDVVGNETAGLANSKSLRKVSFLSCRRMQLDAVRALREVPLRELDVYATRIKDADMRELAPSWPGCAIRMPNAFVLRVPN